MYIVHMKNSRLTLSVLVAIAVISGVKAQTSSSLLTEQVFIELALQRDEFVQIVSLNRRSDSLSARQLLAKWYPDLNLAAELRSTFDNPQLQSTFDPSVAQVAVDTTYSTLVTADLSAHAIAYLPGSGNISADISVRTDSDIFDQFFADYSLILTQPVLAPLYKASAQQLDTKLADITLRQAALNQAQQLAEHISYYREIYLRYFLFAEKVRLQTNLVHLEQLSHTSTRAEYEVGEKSSIDTLRSALKLYQSRVQLQTDQANLYNQRVQIASLLSVDFTQVALPDTVLTARTASRDSAALFALSSTWDPHAKLLQLAQNRHELSLQRAQQALRPSLEVGAHLRGTLHSEKDAFDISAHTTKSVFGRLTWSIPAQFNRFSVAAEQITLEKNQLQQKLRTKQRTELFSRLYANYVLAQRAVSTAQQTRLIAATVVTADSVSIAQGAINELQWRQTLTEYEEAILGYINALVELKQVEIDLDELCGTVFKEMGIAVSWK